MDCKKRSRSPSPPPAAPSKRHLSISAEDVLAAVNGAMYRLQDTGEDVPVDTFAQVVADELLATCPVSADDVTPLIRGAIKEPITDADGEFATETVKNVKEGVVGVLDQLNALDQDAALVEEYAPLNCGSCGQSMSIPVIERETCPDCVCGSCGTIKARLGSCGCG